MNKEKKILLEAQKYMYENVTGFDYDKSKHLLNLLQILGSYPIPKCKPITKNNRMVIK